MTHRRVVDFDSGVAMVVTDLHGEGVVYSHLRDKFLELREKDAADRLIICGDLIHGYGEEADDASLTMLLDVMRLQAELGSDTVVMLMGNHEMPHVYSFSLSKGPIEFTSRFEWALARLDKSSERIYSRSDVIAFLKALPFYVRTAAGVLVSHAGATPVVKSQEMAEQVLDFDHDLLLAYGDHQLEGYSRDSLKTNREYCEIVKQYFAVESPDDPRFTDYLRSMLINQGHSGHQVLWDTLFATNEMGIGVEKYTPVVNEFLKQISAISPWEQRVIVAGHIGVQGGHECIGPHHLRLASYAHAHPHEVGEYLLLDCSQRVDAAADLVQNLRPVFDA